MNRVIHLNGDLYIVLGTMLVEKSVGLDIDESLDILNFYIPKEKKGNHALDQRILTIRQCNQG